jgi:hypothetical protein
VAPASRIPAESTQIAPPSGVHVRTPGAQGSTFVPQGLLGVHGAQAPFEQTPPVQGVPSSAVSASTHEVVLPLHCVRPTRHGAPGLPEQGTFGVQLSPPPPAPAVPPPTPPIAVPPPAASQLARQNPSTQQVSPDAQLPSRSQAKPCGGFEPISLHEEAAARTQAAAARRRGTGP